GSPGLAATGAGTLAFSNFVIFTGESPMNSRLPSSDRVLNVYSPSRGASKYPLKRSPTRSSREPKPNSKFVATPDFTDLSNSKSGMLCQLPSKQSTCKPGSKFVSPDSPEATLCQSAVAGI